MSCSMINVTFSAANLEGVNRYAELVYANVEHVSGFHLASERVIECTQGPNGSYFIGQIQLTVSDKTINSSLVQLDAVEGGWVEGGEAVLELVFGDMRAEVIPVSQLSQTHVLKMNEYLHNKVQEQSHALATLEMQVTKLMEQAAEATATAKNAQTRIDGVQSYLLNYVDLNALVRVVRRIAEEVDGDILEESEIVKIH